MADMAADSDAAHFQEDNKGLEKDEGPVLTNGSSHTPLIPQYQGVDTSFAADDGGEETTERPDEENDNNDESLDYSDGDGGNTEGNYDVNSDKNSGGDSLSESGSYSPNADQLGDEDDSLLEQGTYRTRPVVDEPDFIEVGHINEGNLEEDDLDQVQGDPNQFMDDPIDHAVHDMCDDSESDLGSYHINSDNDEVDGDADSELSDAEYDMSSGVDSDEADNTVELLRVKYNTRQDNPILPDTVSVLEVQGGGKVYLVGTAHFSEKSQQDVAEIIQAVQPDVVMVELCKGRLSILQLDEETLLEEAKDLNIEKLRISIKQHGIIGGVMQVLLLHMSAHLTKELGMAPGGEFRRAFKEAQKVPGCKVHLGDRPIQITLNRAMGALTSFQKLRLAWCLLTSKDPITPEDVERFKQKDLLMELLEEMMGEFPALSRVFVSERDVFLANSLRVCSQPMSHPMYGGLVNPVVVGVVGIGHMPGITEQWNKAATLEEIKQLMRVPPPSMSGRVLRWSLRASLIGVLAWGCYKCIRWSGVTDGLL
ncbi:traB domain-containing protein-like isoform X1 [Asterias rubens]|uniref:traB domain-containing protein-like isoform X1 n=2 Tax=Asterias rubens TaxID=7604 RepID=UPI0014553383|nr:traB domain-containing protein-like isoform X1 [Asterias rubens]